MANSPVGTITAALMFAVQNGEVTAEDAGLASLWVDSVSKII